MPVLGSLAGIEKVGSGMASKLGFKYEMGNHLYLLP